MRLSREVTALYHGQENALLAEERFKSLFQKHEMPGDLAEFILDKSFIVEDKIDVVSLLVQLGFSGSKSEARRLINQGAVRINGVKVGEYLVQGLKTGDILQAGKLKFVRLI
jgi:tyrosyl-tRNA synthetase